MFPHSVSSVRNQVSVLIWWRCHTLRWETVMRWCRGYLVFTSLPYTYFKGRRPKLSKLGPLKVLPWDDTGLLLLQGCCCCSKDSGKVYIDGRRSTWLLLRFLFTPHFPGGHCCNFPLCEGRCCRRSNTVPAHCSGWLIFFKILFFRMLLLFYRLYFAF